MIIVKFPEIESEIFKKRVNDVVDKLVQEEIIEENDLQKWKEKLTMEYFTNIAEQ